MVADPSIDCGAKVRVGSPPPHTPSIAILVAHGTLAHDSRVDTSCRSLRLHCLNFIAVHSIWSMQHTVDGATSSSRWASCHKPPSPPDQPHPPAAQPPSRLSRHPACRLTLSVDFHLSGLFLPRTGAAPARHRAGRRNEPDTRTAAHVSGAEACCNSRSASAPCAHWNCVAGSTSVTSSTPCPSTMFSRFAGSRTSRPGRTARVAMGPKDTSRARRSAAWPLPSKSPQLCSCVPSYRCSFGWCGLPVTRAIPPACDTGRGTHDLALIFCYFRYRKMRPYLDLTIILDFELMSEITGVVDWRAWNFKYVGWPPTKFRSPVSLIATTVNTFSRRCLTNNVWELLFAGAARATPRKTTFLLSITALTRRPGQLERRSRRQAWSGVQRRSAWQT